MKIHKYILFPALLLVFAQANAQPVLNFTRIVNNWPTIELYFKVSCDGKEVFPIGKQYYEIRENGQEIEEFTLWCPDPRNRLVTSVAMVIDCSAKTKDDSAAIRRAALGYLSQLDGIVDEVTVIYAADSNQQATEITTNITDLRNVILSTPANGQGRLWDAAIMGVERLQAKPYLSRGAVIVFAASEDTISSSSPQDAAKEAMTHRIPVYCIGFGDAVNEEQLQVLSHLTLGSYIYEPDREAMVDLYHRLNPIVQRRSYMECLITYQSECPDGTQRTVDFTVKDYCHEGSDSKTTQYRAPRDTTTFFHYYFKLGNAVMAGTDVIVPVILTAPDVATIQPAKVSFGYGDTDLLFDGVEAAGSPLWQPEAVDIRNGAASFTFPVEFTATRGSTIFLLRFKPRRQGIYPPTFPLFIQIFGEQCSFGIAENNKVEIPISSTKLIPQKPAVDFSIAPNPSNGAFEVALEFDAPTAFSMRIVNTLGQTVYQETVSERRTSYSGSIALDSPPGVYFFLLESGGRYDYKTVVVTP